jgi:shikimate dehydrogenase
VEHSLSPAIHNAAFTALGLPWTYELIPVRPEEGERAIRELGEHGFVGANVTMPHKGAAARACTSLSEEAELSGAVNTLVVGEGSLAGHNTDVGGFADFLTLDAGVDPRGRAALLFGSGGAARGCALALARLGLARLFVMARTRERGDHLVQIVEPLGTRLEVVAWDEAPTVAAQTVGTVDLVVNATPVGGSGEALPLPPLAPGGAATVVDLLYRPSDTPLLAQARGAGARAFGGLGLLIRQAARSFELWTGRSAPLEAMRAATHGS